MKTIPIAIIMILLPILSLAASHRCAENFNDGLSFYKEGNTLFDEGNEDLQAFYDLYSETTSTFRQNRSENRPQQENSTNNIITAIKLHDAGLIKTKKAKTKLERSIHYINKAMKYCDGADYNDAKNLDKDVSRAISSINETLFEGDWDEDGDDWYKILGLNYANAKFSLMASLIRASMTDAAIYVIEHEKIDLNVTPKVIRPLLIIAAEHGAIEIAHALISNGADIDIQNKYGYSAIDIAAIRGDDQFFASLFKQRGSTFQLSGFNKIPKYKTCNLADMVHLSSYSTELREALNGAGLKNGHTNILDFLKTKGLTPVCDLNPLLAKVNGKKIHQNDVDLVFTVKIEPEYYQRNSGREMSASDKITLEKGTLHYLISQYLHVQLAQTLGIEVDQDKIVEFATEIHNSLNNVKYEQVRDYVKNEMLTKAVTQHEVIDKIAIPKNELKAFYVNNPDKFTQIESIHARHILMADKNKLAEVLILARKNGSDFSKLAKEYSEGPSKANGGDLGFLKQGKMRMPKPFNDSAFALEEGEISDIVETLLGYHIIKLIERIPAEVVPFEKIKGRLYEHMKQQRFQQEVKKWIISLRDNATIEIL